MTQMGQVPESLHRPPSLGLSDRHTAQLCAILVSVSWGHLPSPPGRAQSRGKGWRPSWDHAPNPSPKGLAPRLMGCPLGSPPRGLSCPVCFLESDSAGLQLAMTTAPTNRMHPSGPPQPFGPGVLMAPTAARLGGRPPQGPSSECPCLIPW